MVRYARNAGESLSGKLQPSIFSSAGCRVYLAQCAHKRTQTDELAHYAGAKRYGHYTAQLLSPELEIAFHRGM